MKNIAFIISDINKALAFEWLLSQLDKQKYRLIVILLNPADSVLEQWIKQEQILCYRVTYKSKRNLLSACWQTCQILRRHKVQVVHSHLFEAGLIGMLAAYLVGIKKRIYTRHYSTMNHHYYRKAAIVDRLINRLATLLVAPSAVVYDTLVKLEHVASSKVVLVHHGFDLNLFANRHESTVSYLQTKYDVVGKFPIVGVIARYTEWKGIVYILEAFKKLLVTYPQAKLVLANARGDDQQSIKAVLETISTQNYVEIAFESDVHSLYHLFDLYVHVPISIDLEAFGQTYVEALAAQVPSVFTLSGVASEFVKHEKNALVVPFKNSEKIYDAMIRILSDQELVAKMTKQGRQDVYERFELRSMISKLEQIYDQEFL